MNEIRLPPADAEALVVAALEASNTSVENAASVARALVGAELCGQGGHGLRRAPAYAAQAKAGKVNGRIVPEVNRIRPGSILVDAGFGFAFPALEMAIEALAEIAPEQGIPAAGIFRSHHAGVAGLTVEALAERGLVALFFSNAPGAMAPWGGKRPLFGTNPIAFACPSAEDGPVIVDVSLSRVARAARSWPRRKRERPFRKARPSTSTGNRRRTRMRRLPAPWPRLATPRVRHWR